MSHCFHFPYSAFALSFFYSDLVLLPFCFLLYCDDVINGLWNEYYVAVDFQTDPHFSLPQYSLQKGTYLHSPRFSPMVLDGDQLSVYEALHNPDRKWLWEHGLCADGSEVVIQFSIGNMLNRLLIDIWLLWAVGVWARYWHHVEMSFKCIYEHRPVSVQFPYLTSAFGLRFCPYKTVLLSSVVSFWLLISSSFVAMDGWCQPHQGILNTSGNVQVVLFYMR